MHPDLTGLDRSCREYTRTVDGLSDEDLAAPSLLPGWTRAHVVAHVALHGLALANVVNGLVHDNPVPMYPSTEDRDEAIESLAGAEPSVLREQHLVATTEFTDALARMHDSHWAGEVDRVPGGPSWPVRAVVPTRRREVEVHHADLGASYSPTDWPEDFVVELLDVVTVDHASSGPFRVRATDLGRGWTVGGDGGPTVTGPSALLGWWLTGRAASAELSCDTGPLPSLGHWPRALVGPER